ncbi:MAG TPA: hypothetical protein VFX49_16130 [Chloroflexota bacterium]|nr:hypothetical protein [Chloroflexota bacterium]
MGQVNVNPGGGTVVERESGTGLGMILGLLLGLALLALVAWWAFTQSGWFGPVAPAGGSTNVNVTTNNPPGGSTTGGSGTTGGTTGGSTTGGTTGR